MSDTPPMIEVKGLKKYFSVRKGVLRRHAGDVRAVDGLDFRVGFRETLSLVGESGCGKTTAGRSLLRLIEPTAGEALYRPTPEAAPVRLFDLPERAFRAYRRDLQIIFQDPYASLNPRVTVGNAIGEALKVHGIARGKARQRRVGELLEMVGLRSTIANRFPHEFLRRPAPARRHRARARPGAEADRLRRGGQRAGRVHPGAGHQHPEGPAGGPRAVVHLHRARPVRRALHLRSRRG